jgi:hypothetical protein
MNLANHATNFKEYIMNTATHKFNHRLLDQLNTGYNLYMPALNWALRKGCEARGDIFLHDTLTNPAELSFAYTINFDTAHVTVDVFRSSIDGPVITNTKALPCADGGVVVVQGVMTVTKRLETDNPKSAKINAAMAVTQALESICVDYLEEQIAKIKDRDNNPLFADRYTLSYIN